MWDLSVMPKNLGEVVQWLKAKVAKTEAYKGDGWTRTREDGTTYFQTKAKAVRKWQGMLDFAEAIVAKKVPQVILDSINFVPPTKKTGAKATANTLITPARVEAMKAEGLSAEQILKILSV